MRYENEIREIIRRTINITEPIDKIGDESALHNAGIDSLEFVKVIIEIEVFFGIEIPYDKLTMAEAGTIKKLCNIVNSQKGDIS